jgi:flagellar biosynthesis protein FliP
MIPIVNTTITTEDNFSYEKELLTKFLQTQKHKVVKIINMRLSGMTNKQIGEKINCNTTRIAYIISSFKTKFKKYLDKK